jgi:(4S)-4-hydroxy-5-phosphonooxypentane-2,3-dione isomerase
MRKSLAMPAVAVALAVVAWVLAPLPVHEAAAESGPLEIHAVEYDVVPDQIDKFLAAVKENAVASVKEPGCRQLDIAVAQNDPNHVYIFEVYDNAAAAKAHTETDHFKKYKAATAGMTTKREAKVYLSVAMNVKGL